MENNEIIEQTAEVATTVAEQVKEPGLLKCAAFSILSILPTAIGFTIGVAGTVGLGWAGVKAAKNLSEKLRNHKAKKEDQKKSKNNDDNVDVGEMPETIDE